MKPIYLEWVDSELPTDGGWLLPHQIETMALSPTVIKTLGFVYRETDDCYVIVCSAASIGCVQGVVAIPKVAIIKALELTIEEE